MAIWELSNVQRKLMSDVEVNKILKNLMSTNRGYLEYR